jgi:hypothetical protein
MIEVIGTFLGMRYRHWLTGLLLVACVNVRATVGDHSALPDINEATYSDFDKVTASADTRSQPDVPRYGLFELTLAAQGSYSNPYLQMPGDDTSPGFVVGTFTGPNNEIITIDGFWDGGQTWKIRMAPTAVGAWTYSTVSSDPGLDGQTGGITCVSSSNRGFVRIHPQNPYAFAYDDGTPFFWMGDTQVIFYHHGRDDYRFDNGSFQTLQDVRASQGITTLFFGSWLWKKPGNFAQNEGGYNFDDSDPDQLNPSFWHYADQRLEYVVSKGMLPGLGIGWPDQGVADFGQERLMRAWRYMISRYAAYNVMWNLFGEADEYGPGWEDWVRSFGNAVKQLDPYDHIVSTHVTDRTGPSLGDDSWLDINVAQRDDWTFILDDRLHNKPVVNLEFGYEGINATADEIRMRAWSIITHGGYFQYGDNLEVVTPGRIYIQNLAEFFTNRTVFWQLQPHNEIVVGGAGYVAAILGQEYVAYLPTGGEVTLNLSAGTRTSNLLFDYEWYNPRTGEITSEGDITGGVVSFTAPDENDWVLHLTAGTGEICCQIYLPQVARQR